MHPGPFTVAAFRIGSPCPTPIAIPSVHGGGPGGPTAPLPLQATRRPATSPLTTRASCGVAIARAKDGVHRTQGLSTEGSLVGAVPFVISGASARVPASTPGAYGAITRAPSSATPPIAVQEKGPARRAAATIGPSLVGVATRGVARTKPGPGYVGARLITGVAPSALTIAYGHGTKEDPVESSEVPWARGEAAIAR